MQYVGKVGGYVYNQWNSLNPATLSGAIDIIVIEQPDGTLHCLPWHIRFGKFQIIKPLQKKIDLYVNGYKTDLPIKLGEGGEAFFVFETDNALEGLLQSVLTSPLVSAASSPVGSPPGSPSATLSRLDLNADVADILDLNTTEENAKTGIEAEQTMDKDADIESRIRLLESSPNTPVSPSKSPTPSANLRIAFEKARKIITQKLNIPSKIDINGDMVLDMDGYKPNSQKNIDNTDEVFKNIFLEEVGNLRGEDDAHTFWDELISKDEDGNIRILNRDSHLDPDDLKALEDDINGVPDGLPLTTDDLAEAALAAPPAENHSTSTKDNKTYFKTLRLTSEQLQRMKLNYGQNQLKFQLNQGTSQVLSNLYLWKSLTPIVISDIDGTITKSDALGHVLNLFGRDWTHLGVATLFQDIHANGYNIIYVTARSVGQADTTRQYLESINQDGGVRLPKGPVILLPDRTMAALKREVILKKPEVFKMACLSDIKSLYFKKRTSADSEGGDDEDDDRTPFYAGFGNRITDAISYRSVKVPSHRIFTINPNGEVHMELLELAGYRSSYLHIGELVDHFFPPLRQVSDLSTYWNDSQFHDYINSKTQQEADSPDSEGPVSPGSPGARSMSSFVPDIMMSMRSDERFSDVNYWRDPLNSLSDFEDLEDDADEPPQLRLPPSSPRRMPPAGEMPGSPASLSLRHFGVGNDNLPVAADLTPSKTERPVSGTFASPLKSFMMFGGGNDPDNDEGDYSREGDEDDTMVTNESDYTGDEDDDDYEDEEDEDYEDEDDDYTGDEEDEGDYDDEDVDGELGEVEDEDVDDEDLDGGDGLPDDDLTEPMAKLQMEDGGFTRASALPKDE